MLSLLKLHRLVCKQVRVVPSCCRTYALSRFPTRSPLGISRARTRLGIREQIPSEEESQLWNTIKRRSPASNAAGNLRRLLEHDTLVIERQIEMLNIFVGFEQSNRYSISSESGQLLGYIAEEPKGFLAVLSRQAFATHRPFRAVIIDVEGSPMMWIRRPFAWINSRMYVQRLQAGTEYTLGGEPILDTFAEVKQVWHLWRRRYDLFIQKGHERVISTASERQPEPEPSTFSQFAKVDSEILAWHFRLLDGHGDEIAYIDRAFRGFGREIFTDTGQYSVRFGARESDEDGMKSYFVRKLTHDERALTLALAVNIDFDYFSRHSGGGRPSYAEAYAKILADFRSSPLTSASSVLILVSPDADAVCAARMLSDLFNQDDVIHRIRPVSGFEELERIRDDLLNNTELHTLILINMGAIQELTSGFGDLAADLAIHIIDSMRPYNLSSLFLGGNIGERFIIWDDGEADTLQEERKAWEALQHEPQLGSDDDLSESDLDSASEEDDVETNSRDDDEEEDKDEGYEPDTVSDKRRLVGDGDGNPTKRRRIDRKRPHRMSRNERERYLARIAKHYESGTYHRQSAAGAIYILATVLERVDNDLLWFATLGLTYQYHTSRISREQYETYHSIYYDEVFRLNPPPPNDSTGSLISLNPDDTSVRTTDELRFMLFRHWTLYDAMYHSSYVASKLGIWKERGRKRLTGLLAKMGFSILQTQQPYSHMDMDLKNVLLAKLNDVAPEYGLLELSYPSFMRCYGYRSQPLSAADAVEGISALLDVACGVKMDVEVEGARNGGEWFGSGRVWEVNSARVVTGKRRDHREESVFSASKVPGTVSGGGAGLEKVAEGTARDISEAKQESWWVKNFWTAFDALDDIGSLREALKLSMSLHRAIIRQGTSIIDKQDIRTMKNHRVVVLSQGPDLALFAHPGVLSRLALWLVDALRDHVSGQQVSAESRRKSLPFVVACLKESVNTYIVVGVTAALDFGDVRRNEFGLAFIRAKDTCNTVVRHSSFDASVLEIEQKDLKLFLSTLCEDPNEVV